MRGRRGSAATVLQLAVAVAAAGAVPAASEEGQTGDSGTIVLECRPGTVNKKVGPRGADVKQPNCYCAETAEAIQSWLTQQAESWLDGEALSAPPEMGILIGRLEPGQEVNITLHCVSPEQVAEYRSQVLAGMESEPGGG